VSRNDYENHFQTILEHEEVHIRQWHSVDIVLIEILKIVFWFNPVLWMYKLALREIHEYLADEQAANRDSYATFLVLYARNAAIRSISNQFYNSSLLKDRIKMIYKGRTSRWLPGKYLLLIPFVTVLVMITAARKQRIEHEKKPTATVATAQKAAGKKGKIIVAKEYTAKEVTVRGKKAKASGKSASKRVALKAVAGNEEAKPVTENSKSADKEEFLQFSNWKNALAPPDIFEKTGESKTFQNYAMNYAVSNYLDFLAPKLTVIEPPKMKFHRAGFITRPAVLRAVDMKFKRIEL
jgi:hypothetical protein